MTLPNKRVSVMSPVAWRHGERLGEILGIGHLTIDPA
jgi:hypothetical protein